MNFLKHVIISLFVLSIISCKEAKQKKNELTNEISFIAYDGELSNGTIQRFEDFTTKYVRPRNVDVWLPNNYSEDKQYAVLYMHDGQMLFDSKITWNKQEWKVDEIVGNLIEEGKIKDCIVVAIWNHSDIRHSDYFPKKPLFYIPKKIRDSILLSSKRGEESLFKTDLQSDNYLKFIVEELKPFIDAKYSVYTNMENTVIAGSSMGGLISMYAICEYPAVFGGAACLSTHWPGVVPSEKNPIPSSFFGYLIQHLPSPKNHKIYFDYGTETLDAYYLKYQHRVDEILKIKGYDEQNSRNLKFEGHDHSENSWNQRLQIPVTFLLKK